MHLHYWNFMFTTVLPWDMFTTRKADRYQDSIDGIVRLVRLLELHWNWLEVEHRLV